MNAEASSRSFLIGLLLVTVSAALSGCAATDEIYKPIVDTRGWTAADRTQYEVDSVECNGYADEVRTGQQAGAGAVGGAVVGGAVGAIFGGGRGAAEGAGAGAVVGGAQGTASGVRERTVVIKNCLRARGYIVLN